MNKADGSGLSHAGAAARSSADSVREVLLHPITSVFAVVFSSASGFAGHAANGNYNVPLMVVTAVAVVIGSQIGARLMVGAMKPRWIRQGFGILLLAIAATLAWGLLT